MNFINSEKVGETMANVNNQFVNNQLEQARREGIRDVVRYLMSYKTTTPWGESVAKHFGIDLNNLEAMPESSLTQMIDEQNKEMRKQFNHPTFEESNSHLNELKINRLSYEEQEEAYLKATGLTKEQYDSIVSSTNKPVHCDARVIHKPGECKYCDEYGDKQQANRIYLGVCFTNYVPHGVDSRYPCPAMFARKDTINNWHGNVAIKE